MADSGRPSPPVSATVGGVIELTRRSLARSWLPAMLVSLLWVGLLVRPLLALNPQDDVLQLAAQLQELVFAPSFGYAFLAVSILSILPYCAVVACVHAGATGGKASGAGLPLALRVFPSALTAATLFMVLTSVGTMVLLVPGVYLWGMWQLWIVVMVVERCGPLRALARSWQLTQGSWWFSVTFVTVMALLSFVPLVLFDLIFPWFTLAFGLAGTQALIASLIGLGVAAILVLPLVPAALVAVYLFLCNRQAGSAVEAG
jgi:hypothetical protein